MLRSCVAVSVLLLFHLAGTAYEDGKNPDNVVERVLMDDEYLKSVEFKLPQGKADPVFRYKLKDGTRGRFSNFDEGFLEESRRDVARVEKKPGGKSATWRLSVSRKAEGATFEIIIGKNLYRVAASKGDARKLTAEEAPVPVNFDKFDTPTKKTWTNTQRRKALLATVRVNTVGSSGTGTIVQPPEKLEALLKRGEELIFTAGHVVPAYLKSTPLQVDVFEYDDALKPGKHITCSARYLYSTGGGSIDVAVLAFTPKTECKFERALVATSNRWFARDVKYLKVGCPDGESPAFRETQAVYAFRDPEEWHVLTDTGSKPGESGGGLFDPDGHLVAILFKAIDESEVKGGHGLVDQPKPFRLSAATTLYTHAHFGTMIARGADALAKEDARWKTIKLPFAHENFGVSEVAEKGLRDARREIEAAVEKLPAESRAEVRKKLLEALAAYEEALKRKK